MSEGLHPPHSLILLWFAPSHKTLRFELNTLNLELGGIYVLHKIKYPIVAGPDTLLQRSTTVTNLALSQKILDLPLYILTVIIVTSYYQ